MPAEIKLEKFEGPLDLLINLIDDRELVITDISLVGVIEQFFSYLDKLEESRDEELADFLVIATKLVYLKSRELLPYLMPADEVDEMSLADQLKLYKQYVDAGEYIRKLWDNDEMAYARVEPRKKNTEFSLPPNLSVDSLKKQMAGLVMRLKPVEALPKAVVDKSISLKNKISNFYNLLKKNRRLNFSDLISGAKNRTEVIMSFLALLELTKQQKVLFEQAGSFDDIVIIDTAAK